MTVVVIGCLEETLDTLSCIYQSGGSVDAIITLSKSEAERLSISNWVCLEGFAKSFSIRLYYVEKYEMGTDYDFKIVQKLSPRAILVIGWQRLIPAHIIELSDNGCIGFHGSANFLPWGRGRSPINWSIIENKNRFILHMFQITPDVDDGDIFGFEIYSITRDDTCRSVYYKTAMAQARLVNRFLPMLEKGNCKLYPQIGEAFHYPKRTPLDGKVDWKQSANSILRLIRGVTFPYPGAFTFLGESKIHLWDASYFGDDLITSDSAPGEVVFISSNSLSELVIKCKEGAILVTKYDADREIKVKDIFQ